MAGFSEIKATNAASDDNTKTDGPKIEGPDNNDEGAKSNPWSVSEWEE